MMKYEVITKHRSLIRSKRQQSATGFYMKLVSPRKQALVQDMVVRRERKKLWADMKKRVKTAIYELTKKSKV